MIRTCERGEGRALTTPTGAEPSRAAKAPRCWFFFSADLPDGEMMVPITTEHGLAYAVRPGACPDAFLERLNEAARHAVGVGLATIQLPQQTPPPEP